MHALGRVLHYKIYIETYKRVQRDMIILDIAMLICLSPCKQSTRTDNNAIIRRNCKISYRSEIDLGFTVSVSKKRKKR